MWRCFLIALLSLNILVHPLCGQAIVRESSSRDCFLGFILQERDEKLVEKVKSLTDQRDAGSDMTTYLANSASCLGSERSTPGMPSLGIFLTPVIYSEMSS